MATSKIAVTQIASGATAAVVAVSQGASTIVGQVNDVADQVSTVTDKAGSIIGTTKQWSRCRSPASGSMCCMWRPARCLMTVIACVCTWFWRRQHARAGN